MALFDPAIFDEAIFDTAGVAPVVQSTQLGGTGGKYYRRNWPDTPKRRRVFDEVIEALEETAEATEKEVARRVRRKLPGVTARQVRNALEIARIEIEDDEAAALMLLAA